MNRNTGMIITIVTALLCSCCALFACIMGFGAITGNGTITVGDTVQPMPPTFGYVFLCLSVIFIIVPVIVGFVTLRRKPEAPVSHEPLPPAS
jgi:hypothetical protein